MEFCVSLENGNLLMFVATNLPQKTYRENIPYRLLLRLRKICDLTFCYWGPPAENCFDHDLLFKVKFCMLITGFQAVLLNEGAVSKKNVRDPDT
mgnify:CR=1 FL=1